MPKPAPSRRDFLKTTAAAAAVLPLAATAFGDDPPAAAKPKPVIGIQTGLPPLAVGDINKTLDTLQGKGRVNALFPFIYTYAKITAGMQTYPNFRGGNFALPHMQYYKDIPLTYQDMRAPDFGDLDVMDRIITAAKKRGMKTFAWVLEDHDHAPTENWHSLYEIDYHGRRVLAHPSGPCYNNPKYLAFVLGLIEDYCRSYDIDGVMWSSERQGGFFNALGAFSHGDPSQGTCFCEFCLKRAADHGIDANRAKRGFAAVEEYARATRAGMRPADGYFVTFFRMLLNYPELLAWERMWIASRLDLQRQIYQLVKSIKPNIPVGWHIWHNVSFSPLHRAEMDYSEIAKISDFIKPVLYNRCAGERMKSFTDGAAAGYFGDLGKPECLEMLYKFLDYQEAPYDQLTATGFSPDYVTRETRRCVDVAAAGAGGRAIDVWPGVEIDVLAPAGTAPNTAETVKQAVLAAFKGGATGLVLSRNFCEMNPDHLAGAGQAIDELHLG